MGVMLPNKYPCSCSSCGNMYGKLLSGLNAFTTTNRFSCNALKKSQNFQLNLKLFRFFCTIGVIMIRSISEMIDYICGRKFLSVRLVKHLVLGSVFVVFCAASLCSKYV